MPSDAGVRADHVVPHPATRRAAVLLIETDSISVIGLISLESGAHALFLGHLAILGGALPRRGRGRLPAGYNIGPADFLDGLSNTAMESEKLLGREIRLSSTPFEIIGASGRILDGSRPPSNSCKCAKISRHRTHPTSPGLAEHGTLPGLIQLGIITC